MLQRIADTDYTVKRLNSLETAQPLRDMEQAIRIVQSLQLKLAKAHLSTRSTTGFALPDCNEIFSNLLSAETPKERDIGAVTLARVNQQGVFPARSTLYLLQFFGQFQPFATWFLRLQKIVRVVSCDLALYGVRRTQYVDFFEVSTLGSE